MELNVSVLGFGDNVVDIYEHISTMYPGGIVTVVESRRKMVYTFRHENPCPSRIRRLGIHCLCRRPDIHH